MGIAKKYATYDDILNLPEHLVGEIVGGELSTSPRPGSRHARTASALGGKLWDPFDEGSGGPGGWWILDEPELHLGGDILVPDLSGWRKSRLPAIADAAYFDVASDWVCEVVSPSTARFDRMKKLPVYAREKVDYTWLIDPIQKTLDIYKLHEGRWMLLQSFVGDEKIRAEPFDAIEIDLSSLWLP